MKEINAAELAKLVNGKLIGDGDRKVCRAASLKDADENSVSFVAKSKYEHLLESTKAGVVLVCKDLANAPLNGRTFIVCDDCDYAFTQAAGCFAPPPIVFEPGIHPSAVVHPTAKIGKNVYIGPCAVIEEGVEIGDGFAAARSRGSINNDPFLCQDGEVVKETNHSGGTLGGMSDGSPLILRAAVKPTPSIAREQKTVNSRLEDTRLTIQGRHDPVIVPRAVVVVEAMTALTIADLLLQNMTSRLDRIEEFYQK